MNTKTDRLSPAKLHFDSNEFNLRLALRELAVYLQTRPPLPAGENDALFEAAADMSTATEAIKRAHRVLKEGL